jgi:predicted amidohydrolase YtcJ
MRSHWCCAALLVACVSLFLALRGMAQGLIVEPADIIVMHGAVYTGNPKQPWAHAVAIRGGKIAAVGDDATIEKRRGMGTRVINAGGKLVLPGLVDCHVHFLQGSLRLDPENLQERSAEEGVAEPTRAGKLLALRAGMKLANRYGITRVHSIERDRGSLELFDEMRRRGDLNVRVYVAYAVDPAQQLEAKDWQEIEAASKKFYDEWIEAGAVSFALGTAAGSPKTENSGKASAGWGVENYKAAVLELDKRGLQVWTEAHDEAAVDLALDAYEKAEEHHKRERRLRVEGVESVAEADVTRFGGLGVIAGMQPLHFADGPRIESGNDANQPVHAWSWKELAEHRARVAFGSDWPERSLNPWEALEAAVARASADGTGEAATSSVEQALAAYTSGAAFAGKREKFEGSIEEGKLADLILVSQNIFEVSPRKIAKTEVLTTIVGGRVVYQANKK